MWLPPQTNAISSFELSVKKLLPGKKAIFKLVIFVVLVTEGSLEVKLPTICTDEKQSRAEAERRERLEERRSEKRKSQKKEDADARKGRKVAKHCVFPMIWGSGGSKSRLAKAAGEEPAGQIVQNTLVGPLLEVEMSKKCTPWWREAHFEVKILKH